MRKLICLAVAAVMLLNVPVYAASYASLNKTRTIRDETEPSDQYLKITPLDEVSTGSSIIISFTNAKVPDQSQIDAVYQYGYYNWKGSSEGFWDVMTKVKTNELPYKIRRVGAREIQVSLINLPRRFADTSLYTVNGTIKRPVYRIRLPFIADGEGTIQININNNESTISSATLSGYYVWSKGSGQSPSVFDNTEGTDGEIISETLTETTTAAASAGSSSEGETETATELPNIFDLNYNDYIAVRDLGDIIENSLFNEESAEATTEAALNGDDGGEETSEADCETADKTDETEPDESPDESPDEAPAEFDLDVSWDAYTKTATITYNGIEVRFISYSDYYIVNGEKIYFESGLGSVIIDGKMYVPAGLVTDILKLKAPEEAAEEEAASKDDISEEEVL